MTLLFQCKTCGPATDHGSGPARSGRAKPWRTIDIHCHCMVPEANAMVQKATGITGGGHTPNANAHVNEINAEAWVGADRRIRPRRTATQRNQRVSRAKYPAKVVQPITF